MDFRRSLLVYDLIACVMELCQHDYDLLYRCSLVNWEFNRAASRMLYALVFISPKFSPVLDLRETSGIPESSNFGSASLPQNAPYVLSLEIKGYISQRPPSRNSLSSTLADTIPLFVNLRRVRLTPATYHEDLFVPVLPALLELQRTRLGCNEGPNLADDLPSIQPSPSTPPSASSRSSGISDLIVNQSCLMLISKPADASEAQVETEPALVIVQLEGLRRLSLINPGRAILQILPDWLGRLEKSLVELHLMDNCGSVTPGVLKSFIPHIKDRIQSFTLGLSYSLTDDDVFAFLGQLQNLRRVHLRYYWQMRPPSHQPPLPSLRSFTVTHPQLVTAKEVRDFGKWVRRALTGSPALEVLRLKREGEGTGTDHVDEDEEGEGGGVDFFGRTVHSFLSGSDEGRVRAREEEQEGDSDADADGEDDAEDDAEEEEEEDDRPPPSHLVSHTGLVDHVLQKHVGAIRVLDLGEALVCVRQLRDIIARCERLEVLRCVLGKQGLAVFTHTLKKPSLPRLRAVSFRLSDIKRSVQPDALARLAYEILDPAHPHPSLRRLEINGVKWEASWVVVVTSTKLRFVVRRVREVAAPWERKPVD